MANVESSLWQRGACTVAVESKPKKLDQLQCPVAGLPRLGIAMVPHALAAQDRFDGSSLLRFLKTAIPVQLKFTMTDQIFQWPRKLLLQRSMGPLGFEPRTDGL